MNNGRLSNGFVLGLIVGGATVFFFGTKTGKKLLKRFSEEGFEGLTEMLEEVDLGDYEEEPLEETSTSNHHQGDEELKEEIKEASKEPTKKRFFRKAKN